MVKVKILIGEEWDPVTCDRDVWEDLLRLRISSLQIFKGFSSKEIVSPFPAEYKAPPLKYCLLYL